jgi:hypothetical protein
MLLKYLQQEEFLYELPVNMDNDFIFSVII